MKRTVLITGAAGFIGFHLSRRLIEAGDTVIGVDNLSDRYDVNLKLLRQSLLVGRPGFSMVNGGIERPGFLTDLFSRTRPDVVIHLAAQAGVRQSTENPRPYLDSNIAGTFELLEAARRFPPAHMLLASTSSVYGANTAMPYVETHATDHPMSFYAATKKATEAMTHPYANLFGLPLTMFRFFTVYGPWGRPDMAMFKFTRAILRGEAIDVYNNGALRRDFTYIDDLVEAVRRLMDAVPQRPADGIVPPGDSLSPVAPWRVVNIGTSSPVELNDFIAAIERATDRKAVRNLLPMQPGDVHATWADSSLLTRLVGPIRWTDLDAGVGAFVDWYRGQYEAGALTASQMGR